MDATKLRERIGSQSSDIADAINRLVHESGRRFGQTRAAGIDNARALGQHISDGAHDVHRSTRKLVKGHPVESLLLVGIVGVVGGWLIRHVYQGRSDKAALARSSARPARVTSKAPRRKAAKSRSSRSDA